MSKNSVIKCYADFKIIVGGFFENKRNIKYLFSKLDIFIQFKDNFIRIKDISIQLNEIPTKLNDIFIKIKYISIQIKMFLFKVKPSYRI